MLKVLKFGGTSVGSAERIKTVKSLIEHAATTCDKVVVVVSAMGGVTDALIDTARKAQLGDETYRDQLDEIYYRHRKAAEELFTAEQLKAVQPFLKEQTRNLENLLYGVLLIKELSARVLDTVMSYGETVSAFVIAHYLKHTLQIPAQHLDSKQLIKTDSNFGAAAVQFEQTNARLQQAVSGTGKGVFVMGGFIASDHHNVVTTLGRGGSDYTAAIAGAALNASEIEIWTDVDGVMTADPRKVKKAFSLLQMTYEEAMEMSHFGAKVIHPPTIQPALDKKIPLRIKNTFNPGFPGTLITTQTPPDEHPVKGISSIAQIALVSLQGSGLIGVTGIAGRLFSALAKKKVNIILITQASSEHSISFAINPHDTHNAQTAIAEEFLLEMRANLIEQPTIETGLSVVAVIGSNMRNSAGVSGRMFRALGINGINIRAIAQGSSELNISTVISQSDVSKALNALHEAFFLSDTKTAYLFMVGTGLIGATLLQQIQRQQAHLLQTQSLELKLLAIANSKQMLFDEAGIDLARWSELLESNGQKADLGALVAFMQRLNLPNSIFADCTASPMPVQHYKNILSSNISIVTPNKIANSGSYENYMTYRTISQKKGGKFRYETNVGAGLPIIGTLTDLLKSGDEVLKIEAVLSGSLSFIFNHFTPDTPFSDVVRRAQELGYTEPDPRDDLSGKDMARKVLILSREIGQAIELEDIAIENILPDDCIKAPTVAGFYAALEKHNPHFAQMQQRAMQEGKKLRFLATIDKHGSSVSLQAVLPDNPFYQLSGSDNMIVFTTARYHDRPLVVKGPGAGAEVTAAGVFAEIISLANYLS
ncbi:bifunctional aspartate kinase/homoserine dehydrogenase I [Sphingobacteriales bacterium UPWRP_1]|nr:bifunctional aspartate kinase/homoserine dehydrogenase I [Sphingobacteriales bacterium TSM_CSM]PSJ76767.1 bifunctional aspartate kinase/homoserine dehydrogenase I [Sphingobacteriales bacterium UPWRP_1]